jgi:sterol desaturase/sphingolipid hydroxylase (fatty acid hydroxylase superfamily)
MMLAGLSAFLNGAGATLGEAMPAAIVKLGLTMTVLGVVFAVLTHLSACNPGKPWWRKREIVTDLWYWFLVPLLTRYFRIGMLGLGAALLFGIHGSQALSDFYEHGHGPLSALPMWTQVIVFMVASDFMLYWLHRAFHRGNLWKYHAVHHSSEDLDWISAARFHPVNLFLGAVGVDVVLLLAGISLDVMVWVGPFITAHSGFVHANLKWSLGPFKYVLASPVFHRWHHTAIDRGGSTNFAGTFPIWDVLFGTFNMPANVLPDAYGIDDKSFPESFSGQMLYPFTR